MENFIQSTIDPNLFRIEDVLSDNACFYRSIANFIHYAVPSDKMNSIKRFTNWGSVKEINKCLGQYSPEQDELARFIQRKIVNYVKKNPDLIIPQTGTTLENSIQLIHELTLDEYVDNYKIFAGDIDIENDESDEEFLIDRWGSFIEQTIISDIIKCPIIVFNTQRFDTRNNKIVNGKIRNNKAEKDVRLRVSAIIGENYMMKKLPIFLIWREYLNNGHYMVCYPKDATNIKELLNLI